MCVIAISLSNAPREPKENFIAMAAINDDGIGAAYNLDDKLIVKRGFPGGVDELYEFYSGIPADSSVLVHFRKCSVGKVTDENLHPFIVNENLCFAFNGTISGLKLDESKSDTFFLNELIIQKLLRIDKKLYETFPFKTLLNSYIGSSKMVMLDNTGKFVIFNEVLGDWNAEKNVWYSNKSWEKKVPKTPDLPNSNKRFRKTYKHVPAPHYSYPSQLDFESIKAAVAKNPKLGNPELLKKKYYLVGDPLYKELDLNELDFLSKRKNCGIKKLVKKHRMIRPLEDVSDDVVLEARLKVGSRMYQEAENAAQNIIENVKKEMENAPLLLPPPGPLTVSIGEMLQKP